MTNGISVNPYSDLGYTTVVKWGSQPDGANNDCYWNIAKNSLGSDASNTEIYYLMNELMELNASWDTEAGKYDPMLHPNEQVLMTISQSVESASSALSEASEAYNSAFDAYNDAVIKLSNFNTDVESAYNAYIEAISNGNDDVEALYNAYIDALQAQANASNDINSQKK